MKMAVAIDEMMKSDPEYVLLEKGNGLQVNYEQFLFGRKAYDALMDLQFGCQRCGNCCRVRDERCSDLHTRYGTSCDIHESREFPVECSLWPFNIDNGAVEGWGKKLYLREDVLRQKKLGPNEPDYIHYQIGVLDGWLCLDVNPNDPAWGKGPPLRESFRNAVKRLADFDPQYDVLMPPDMSIFKPFMNAPGIPGVLTEDVLAKANKELARRIAESREFFLAKLLTV